MTDQFTLRKLKEQCENVFQAFFFNEKRWWRNILNRAFFETQMKRLSRNKLKCVMDKRKSSEKVV